MGGGLGDAGAGSSRGRHHGVRSAAGGASWLAGFVGLGRGEVGKAVTVSKAMECDGV